MRARPVPRGLSKADQQLWAAFTQNIVSLPGKARLPVEEVGVAPPPVVAKKAAKAEPGLDQATRQKFIAGKIRAVQRLDLHGMTAARAHHAVGNFVERAYLEQNRCIEIITGKGEILARELPHWLGMPPLRGLILATAHPHAANTGSVRILLRRIR